MAAQASGCVQAPTLWTITSLQSLKLVIQNSAPVRLAAMTREHLLQECLLCDKLRHQSLTEADHNTLTDADHNNLTDADPSNLIEADHKTLTYADSHYLTDAD